MKYIWEEEDIVPGIYVCKPAKGKFSDEKPDMWDAKWTYKIGFMPSEPSAERLCLISMTDGQVSCIGRAIDLVEYFNGDQLIPMPHNRLVEILNYLGEV